MQRFKVFNALFGYMHGRIRMNDQCQMSDVERPSQIPCSSRRFPPKSNLNRHWVTLCFGRQLFSNCSNRRLLLSSYWESLPAVFTFVTFDSLGFAWVCSLCVFCMFCESCDCICGSIFSPISHLDHMQIVGAQNLPARSGMLTEF